MAKDFVLFSIVTGVFLFSNFYYKSVHVFAHFQNISIFLKITDYLKRETSSATYSNVIRTNEAKNQCPGTIHLLSTIHVYFHPLPHSKNVLLSISLNITHSYGRQQKKLKKMRYAYQSNHRSTMYV